MEKQLIWVRDKRIGFGAVVTYGELVDAISTVHGIKKVSTFETS